MFYVFMVWNKSLTTHTLIYDMANNILFEDKDITVKIVGDDSLTDFLTDAKEKVQKKSHRIGVKKTKENPKSEEPPALNNDPAPRGFHQYPYPPYGWDDPYDLGGPAWTL
jgi:hypothetical protein